MVSIQDHTINNFEYPSDELALLKDSNATAKKSTKPLSLSLCCGLSLFLCCIFCVILIVSTVLISWFILGSIAFNIMFYTVSECTMWGEGNLPTNYWYHGPCDDVYPLVPQSKIQPFFVSNDNDWNVVYFPSRQSPDNILWTQDKRIAAYIFEQKTARPDDFHTLPWIINVHGRFSCKNGTLLFSGMSYRSGYNSLTLDLRNCGQSSDTNGKLMSFGSEEHFDVLGAYDYIQTHFPNNKGIGLIGNSMGGATALIAFAKEKGFKAALIDSGVCSVYDTLASNVNRMAGVPVAPIVMSSLCLAAPTKQVKECPPFRYDPAALASQIDRPILFHHSIEDEIVPVSNPKLCASIIKEAHPNTPVFEVYHNFPYVKTCGGGHSQLQWSELDDYYNRLNNFFGQYLPLV